MTSDFDLKTIDDLGRLVIADDKGNPALRFGYVIKLYFERAFETAVRERLLRLVEDYGSIVSDHITHYMPIKGSRLKKTKDFDYASYYRKHLSHVQAEPRIGGFEAELYGFAGGVDRDEPTPFHIAVVARPAISLKRLGNEHNALGRLEAYLPADWPQGDHAACLALIRRWAEIGRPIHGTLGLGLIMEEGCARGPFMPLAFPFLRRFSGLEYPDQGLWRTMSEDATTPVIRAVNWLTTIDARRAEAIGGEHAIRSAVEPACSLHPYDGGGIIQAGATPELGDLNRGEPPVAYRAVARALKPLRFEDYGRWGIFGGLPSPLDDRQETLRWVRRFD